MLNSDREMMRPRKIFNLTLLLFFLALFSVPVFWIIRGENPQKRSIIEGRELVQFSFNDRGFLPALKSLLQGHPAAARTVFFEQFFNRIFQQDLEKAASDQFPLRIQAIQISKFIDRQIINLAYGFLTDPAIPTDMQSGLYIMRDKSQIFFGPAIFDESQTQMIDARIENYASLINSYPNINFYAYYFERLEYSKYHPLNPYFSEADAGRSFLYFEENIPSDLNLGKMMFASFEDHAKYFYRTDHHWNINGILRAYYGIHNLLAENYPEISSPIIIDGFYTFQDIEFLGSLARKSLYPIRADKFTVALYNLPPFKILENGQEIIYNQSDQYLAGNYSTAPYTSHYIEYFGYDAALLEYVFENESDRNLLLIGNSFDNPLQPLLAYHYHHTYSVDLRFYEDFSLSDFLSQYDVDDILIVGSSDVVCLDNEWMIVP
jgi:hypothetical protein